MTGPPADASGTSRQADTPVALVLTLVRSTCATCGTVHTAPDRAIKVRYDRYGLSNSVHYTRTTLTAFAELPRQTVTVEIAIPYCQECF